MLFVFFFSLMSTFFFRLCYPSHPASVAVTFVCTFSSLSTDRPTNLYIGSLFVYEYLDLSNECLDTGLYTKFFLLEFPCIIFPPQSAFKVSLKSIETQRQQQRSKTKRVTENIHLGYKSQHWRHKNQECDSSLLLPNFPDLSQILCVLPCAVA